VTRGLAALAALGFAYVAKAWYSGASAEDLAFLLAPTAGLVELTSGGAFQWEPGMGYLSRAQRFLIAPVCAGGNFFVVAFTTLALAFAPRRSAVRAHAGWLLAAAGIAWGLTVAVNAARIAAALALRESELPLPAGEAHRALGVAVYLGGLLVGVGVVSWALGRGPELGRAALLGVGVYLAVTLVVPWLRGVGASPEFWEHARGVGAITLGVAALVLTAAAAVVRARAPASARRQTRPRKVRSRSGNARPRFWKPSDSTRPSGPAQSRTNWCIHAPWSGPCTRRSSWPSTFA
jgi:exosortase K